MKYKGIGIVWNPKKNKRLCSFAKGAEYETDNEYEISILNNCPQVETICGEVTEKENNKTKKQLIYEAKEAGITGSDRMSKDELITLLGA